VFTLHRAEAKNKWAVCVNMAVCLWAARNAENFCTICATVSFSRRDLLNGFKQLHSVPVSQVVSEVRNVTWLFPLW